MNVEQVTQSNAASLPPPDDGVGGSLSGVKISMWPTINTLKFPKAAAAENVITSVATLDLPRQAAPVLILALATRWRSYAEALRACQDCFSEHAVHELRVATRRLLSQLVMLGCVTDAPQAEAARRVLKRRLKALGSLRDAHVLRLSAEKQMRRFPELLLVRDYLEKREARLEKSVAEKVRKFKTHKLEQWILALGKRLARSQARSRQPDRLTAAVLRAATAAYREVVRRREAIDETSAKTVHRTRIAFKRFRYMVEALSPDFTGLGEDDLRELARYQRRMGNLQDLEVMQECLSEFVGDHPRAKTLLKPFYDYLQQRRRRALRSFLKSADELYEFWPARAQEPTQALSAA